MLVISKEKAKTTSAVEFVSYTGSYPCLCMGILTVKINGKEVKFGGDFTKEGYKSYKNRFWESGGSCGFSGGYSESYVNHGEWKINVNAIPEEYRKYASELDAIINANIPEGCCGGCL